MLVNLPPKGSGAYLGIDRVSLKKRGIEWDNYKITLTPTQISIMEKWEKGEEISRVELWGSFGASKLTCHLEDWFRDCLAQR